MAKKCVPLKDESGNFVMRNGFVVYVYVDDEVVQNQPTGKVSYTR